MTGGAGAGAPAIGIDAGNAVLDRALHHGPAHRHVDRARAAIVGDVGDLGHQSMVFMGTPRSARRAGSTRTRSAISLRPVMYSGPAFTASTAATAPSRKWNTANLRDAGSPRKTSASPGRASPAICNFRSYWSDQNHGTSR